jgi:hypothetical protein
LFIILVEHQITQMQERQKRKGMRLKNTCFDCGFACMKCGRKSATDGYAGKFVI